MSTPIIIHWLEFRHLDLKACSHKGQCGAAIHAGQPKFTLEILPPPGEPRWRQLVQNQETEPRHDQTVTRFSSRPRKRENAPRHSPKMQFSMLLSATLALLTSRVMATALTYRLEAHEKACFYASSQNPNDKIAFYFAVQSGGSFDVDYLVKGPQDKIILQGEKERQGDFAFTAQQVGEYSFCFSNEMSTFAEKFVDFEISVEGETRAELPSKQGSSPDQTEKLDDSIYKISGQLSAISRNQKYFRTRENRNFATVSSTESRIVNFSMIQILLVVAMAGLQVFVVRFFFQGARKGYV